MTRRITFRTKLLLLTILPLAIAQLVTVVAVMRTVASDIEQRARESLIIGATVVNEFLHSRAEQLRTSVAVLAADFGLKEAAATGDAATIRSVLDNHSRRVGADFAALVDLDGALIATNLDDATRHRVDVIQLIADASQQQRESTALLGDSAYHLFSEPLRAPVTIGWIVAGFEIDLELVDRIGGLTGLDVTILHTGPDMVTIIESQADNPGIIDIAQPVNAVYMAEDANDQALSIQTPFVPDDSSVIVVLQRSLLTAMQPYVEARSGLIAFGAVLLLLVAAAGGWFSTTVSKPLKTLGDAARRMISGDYQSQVRFRSDDEFGDLASSFNAMQTAIAEREQRISHHALHDPLTDLPNRSRVLTELTRAIEQARGTDAPISILSIRFARMGEISSTLGHNATDELIKMAALQMRASLSDIEVLGHIGTNEFVLILANHDTDEALAYVRRLDSMFASGITLGKINIILQANIGISGYPLHGDVATDLLRFAAIARTEAETSQEQVRVYLQGREDEFLRRLRIVNDLPSALRRGDIETWFQPKVSLPDGNVYGAEALVRWRHNEFGFLSPDDFIPAAERAGTIVVLTRAVIAAALQRCREWRDRGFGLSVSVNLSARDLLNEFLVSHVAGTLADTGLPAEALTLEVTESSIMEDLRRSVAALDALSDLGVRISMDDFGTGHSSLAQLRNIPLHELKIDKSFVMTLCEDEHNDAIVRTTIKLAHGMGLQVVAEGVESESAMRRLANYGCAYAQGYCLSKPMNHADFERWLEFYEPASVDDRRGDGRAFAS